MNAISKTPLEESLFPHTGILLSPFMFISTSYMARYPLMSFAKVTFSNDPQEYQYDLSSLYYGVNQMDLWYAIVCLTNNDLHLPRR